MSFEFSVLSFSPSTFPEGNLGWVGGKFEIRNSKFENGVKTSQESQWSG